ncbi:MAG TPA: RnfABCDGE type electron transport complex subunit A [bacterium]|jgi:electron transport complex protein RnfA|nr:RnfABCDGE type electron transport complex subunit A [Dictyoglomota bacterium]HHV81109.1 RnfABCDGE type electron transport complex subunit A [bacterium]HOK28955.1 RnfABCDGE type electron transport complex subunit A [bacterium]HOL54667.1 RnfABCDGE type electron transport complex subunit A [bacterium]HOP55196.1 RnfABCDGE type electron transport complex subunit A [bacterium]
MFSHLLLLFIGALLVNNILLIRFIALCAFFGVSNSMSTSIGMGMAVTFVMVLTSSVTWILWNFVLVPLHLEYLQISVFILTIAALVQFVELFLKKNSPSLYRAMGIYLPLITTNCAILAVAFIHVSSNFNFIETIVYTIGVSGGYTLAIVMFAGIRERLASAPVPRAFQGYPLAFITASLMSLAFLGFKGLFGL